MDDVVTTKFALMPEGVYFLNFRDNNKLYFWNEAEQAVTKLDDTNAYTLYCDENYCWINSMDGFFRIDNNGSNKQKLDCPGLICGFTAGSALYLYDYETDTIYSVDKQSLACSKLFY